MGLKGLGWVRAMGIDRGRVNWMVPRRYVKKGQSL